MQRGKPFSIIVPCGSAAANVEFSSIRKQMKEHRSLIGNCVQFLLPRREVAVHAPVNVEVVVMRDDTRNEYIVHLVGFWPRKNVRNSWRNTPVTSECMEEPAIYRAEIVLAGAVERARALSPETKVETKGNMVNIETQQVHEAVIVSLQ